MTEILAFWGGCFVGALSAALVYEHKLRKLMVEVKKLDKALQ